MQPGLLHWEELLHIFIFSYIQSCLQIRFQFQTFQRARFPLFSILLVILPGTSLLFCQFRPAERVLFLLDSSNQNVKLASQRLLRDFKKKLSFPTAPLSEEQYLMKSLVLTLLQDAGPNLPLYREVKWLILFESFWIILVTDKTYALSAAWISSQTVKRAGNHLSSYSLSSQKEE